MSSTGCTESTNAPSDKRSMVARILHITDFHFLAVRGQTLLGIETELSFAAVLETIKQKPWQPDLALLTGDLAQDPCALSYERLKERLAALGIPCYCLPGNHDDPDLMSRLLSTGNVHVQPRIFLDKWEIICLDSTIRGQPGGRLTDGQLRLLENSLTEHPDRYILIALHHHPVPSGSLWMDTMVLENADDLLAIAQRYEHVKGIVFGHVHQVMDEVRGRLRLLASPSTCFQFKPRSSTFALDRIPPGYRWIELYSDGTIETGVERLTEVPTGLELTSEGY